MTTSRHVGRATVSSNVDPAGGVVLEDAVLDPPILLRLCQDLNSGATRGRRRAQPPMGELGGDQLPEVVLVGDRAGSHGGLYGEVGVFVPVGALGIRPYSVGAGDGVGIIDPQRRPFPGNLVHEGGIRDAQVLCQHCDHRVVGPLCAGLRL